MQKYKWADENKHGKKIGAHLDNPDDLYDHTAQFFDGEKGDFDIEIGEKRYKPNIADLMDDLDSKIYGAVKVSRQEREESYHSNDEESSNDSASSAESGEHEQKSSISSAASEPAA